MVVVKAVPSVEPVVERVHAGTAEMGQSCTGRSLCHLPCCVETFCHEGSELSVSGSVISGGSTDTPDDRNSQQDSRPNSADSASLHVRSCDPWLSARELGMWDSASHCACEADDNEHISTAHWRISWRL